MVIDKQIKLKKIWRIERLYIRVWGKQSILLKWVYLVKYWTSPGYCPRNSLLNDYFCCRACCHNIWGKLSQWNSPLKAFDQVVSPIKTSILWTPALISGLLKFQSKALDKSVCLQSASVWIRLRRLVSLWWPRRLAELWVDLNLFCSF